MVHIQLKQRSPSCPALYHSIWSGYLSLLCCALAAAAAAARAPTAPGLKGGLCTRAIHKHTNKQNNCAGRMRAPTPHLCVSACARRTGCCGAWAGCPRTPRPTPASPCVACRVRAAAQHVSLCFACVCCACCGAALRPAPPICVARRATKLCPPAPATATDVWHGRHARCSPGNTTRAASDSCQDACQRAVCMNMHQVPAWNEACLKRCTTECERGRAA